MSNYYSLICYLLIKKISYKLYLEDDNEKESNVYSPFVELILKETQTIFYKKLDSSNETRIFIADIELFEIPFIRKNYDKNCNNSNENSIFKILSEFTQNIITGEIEDFENDYTINKEERRKYIRKKTLRESTKKEEKLFKTNVNEKNNKEYENLKKNLFSKHQFSQKNVILFDEDNPNQLDLNNDINESNINNNKFQSIHRKNKKKPTIKITKNDNKM